ncbi:MAG: 2-oxoacid:acceptor oxidoreductase subunit alpha [Candidatus Hydrothermarchaeota archaeon]
MSETRFIQGNTACAEASLLAGCRFFAGYPITPSTEIMERLAIRMPEVGGVFIQMEDEIGSIMAVIGASWAGKKAMTATSGPGLSLMQEGISYACMTETPCVIVDVQRGGPATGMPTLPSQSDVMASRYGGHGDYETIVYAPSSVQEMFDFTVRCFNMAEKYRVPCILLSDAIVAHLREKIEIPTEVEVYERKEPKKGENYFLPDESLVPKMPTLGKGFRAHITGLTHDTKGFPTPSDTGIHQNLVQRLKDKIRKNIDDISDIEVINEDADIFLLSYGSVARSCLQALMEKGSLNIGMVRLKSIWPFHYEKISEILEGKKVLVVEMNLGQIFNIIRLISKKATLMSFFGDIPSPEDILKKIRSI